MKRLNCLEQIAESFVKSLLYVCLLASGLLAGCGERNIPGVEPPVQGMPIGFSSSVTSQTQTRGEVVTSITEMYIFASFTAKADWKSVSHSFNYMYEQYANNPGSGWTYSPVKYWPGNADDKISFFAYAPIGAKTNLTVSAVNAANPSITYTVPAKESDKLDFLVAGNLNCTNTTGTVSFPMQHALMQLVVNVKNGDTAVTDVTLSGVNVTMPGVGKLFFNDTGSTAGKVFSWTPGDTKEIVADVTVGGTSARSVSLGTSSAGAKAAATFFLLPVGDPSAKVKFQLTYKLKKNAGHNSGESPVMTAFIVPPATPVWTAGKVLTYTISIIDDRLEISGVTVADFDANGTSAGGNIPAT